MTSTTSKIVFGFDHAGFSYPYEQQVLKDLSFEIRAGERVCILGANGCGKSTLLKICAGLLLPQDGKFSAFQSVVTEKQLNDDRFTMEYHRRVGFIFQDSDVQLFCSTVEEEIAFGLLQQNLSDETVRQRMEEIIHMLGIEHLSGRTPFKLSGGERKKVALASVLVMNPEVLILDEPTNGLDPRTQAWLIRLLNTLNQAGRTIITSTHHLDTALKISDRAILLDENHKIVADRAVKSLVKDAALLKAVNLVDENYVG